jgi:OOP family OmpA-OmpF porin
MKYRFFLSMVAMLFAINVSAQETKDYPHAFIGVQGGVMKAYNG